MGVAILCAVALLIVVWYYVFEYNFWRSRGVPGPRPIPFFGNSLRLALGKTNMAAYVGDIYKKYEKEPFVGLYIRSPQLLVKDPDLIKDILIKDFHYFMDRGTGVFEKTEPLSLHLANLDSKRWRPLRKRLSPQFTTARLKDMFTSLVPCAENLEKYLENLVKDEAIIDIQELCAKYTIDCITSSGFGIEANLMSDRNDEFHEKGKEVFRPNWLNSFRLKMRLYAPSLYQYVGYILSEKRLTPFFTQVANETMKYREENNVFKPDFMNMLMELKKHPEYLPNIELTDSFIAAQVFIFFSAGYETSSTTMSNALHELARNQHVQDKVRKEIREQYAILNGRIQFDDLKKLPYLEKVFKETLRLYPPTMTLQRMATFDYTFKDYNFTIPKGTKIYIPQYSLQRDPNVYANPDTFDPERFNEDEVAARHPMYYIPFGTGPRNCIGIRVAHAKWRLGMVTILRNYKVEVCEKTAPYRYDSNIILLAPKDGIHLKLTRVEN